MQKESNWTVLLLIYVLYYIFVRNTNYIKLKKDNFLHTNISPTFLLLGQRTSCNFLRFDRKYKKLFSVLIVKQAIKRDLSMLQQKLVQY